MSSGACPFLPLLAPAVCVCVCVCVRARARACASEGEHQGLIGLLLEERALVCRRHALHCHAFRHLCV